MFDNSTVGATAVFASVFTFVFLWMKRNGTNDAGKQYPPSASTLSLLGDVLRKGMGVLPEHFMKAAEKLGPVISYNFGRTRVIILNGKEAISEAFLRQSEAFADRPEFWTESNVLNENLRGIIFARYNNTLKKYHRLCLAILKEFGFGVNSVSETRILREVESLNETFLKLNGCAVDPKPLTVVSTLSVVSNILFGERFMTSGTCHRISEALNQYNRNIGFAIEFAPFLRFLPNFRKNISAMVQSHTDIMNGLEEGIKCSKSTDCESTFVRRFIEIQGSDYDRQDLLYILRDLCLASADTVASTLQWAMVELANHPEVQSRFQREIDDVIPKDRLPSLDDKPRLPYTETVILEIMRRHTLVPLYVPHAAFKDGEVFGCYIPKGSTVLANAFSAHMDPKFWQDPENFRPERFLDENDMITGSENVIPFGLGKRSCLGEVLGRQETFLFLTSLVQHFDIRPPEGQKSINVKEVTAVAVFPSEFKVRLIPRIEYHGIKKL